MCRVSRKYRVSRSPVRKSICLRCFATYMRRMLAHSTLMRNNRLTQCFAEFLQTDTILVSFRVERFMWQPVIPHNFLISFCLLRHTGYLNLQPRSFAVSVFLLPRAHLRNVDFYRLNLPSFTLNQADCYHYAVLLFADICIESYTLTCKQVVSLVTRNKWEKWPASTRERFAGAAAVRCFCTLRCNYRLAANLIFADGNLSWNISVFIGACNYFSTAERFTPLLVAFCFAPMPSATFRNSCAPAVKLAAYLRESVCVSDSY